MEGTQRHKLLPATVMVVVASLIFSLPGYFAPVSLLGKLLLPGAVVLLAYAGYSIGGSAKRLVFVCLLAAATCVVASVGWATLGRPLWEPLARAQAGDLVVVMPEFYWLNSASDALRSAAWAVVVTLAGSGVHGVVTRSRSRKALAVSDSSGEGSAEHI
jgi:hypothetical protein